MISISHLNLGIFFLLMTSRTTFSQDMDIEHLYRRIEVLRSDIRSLHTNLREVETLMNTYFIERDVLKMNQNAINSKLENVFSEVEVIKENSDSTKNRFAQLPLKEDYNKLEEIVTSNLKLIYSEVKNMYKILREIEDSKDYNKLEEIVTSNLKLIYSEVKNMYKILREIEDSKGEETTCTDLSKTLLSVVKALFYINISQYEYAISNIEKCWKDLPETMLGHRYFVTPKLKQEAAAKYCKDHGGKPFIPKTEDEFLFYVAMTVQPDNHRYIWYPVNDIKEEGHLVLQDGSDYEKASYKLQKWDPIWNNSKEADCVAVDIFGEGLWLRCYYHDFVLLCQENLS